MNKEKRNFKGKLAHIELYVSNLQKSLLFWDWFLKYLGYSEYQCWELGKSWIKDGTYIVIVQTDRKYLAHTFHRCHTGLNHLAFYADTPEEIDELTLELRKRSIKILYEESHPYAGGKDYYAVFFEDPDRIKVEVVLFKKKS